MQLKQAFRIVRGDVVSFIGAGGKTSALIALGHELVEAGWRVLATTTTRIGREQLDLMPTTLDANSDVLEISAELESSRFVFLYTNIGEKKVQGASVERITTLLDSLDSDVLLIEADGSRGLPLKAHYDHEPVIPLETTLVVPIVSLAALGKPLTDTYVYNPEAINNRYGFGLGNRIKSPWVAQILRDEELTLRNVPEKARIIALVNQVPAKGYLRGRARLIAQLALRPRSDDLPIKRQLHGVVLGAVRSHDPVHEVHRPVSAIVLAGGMSRRMGQSKVLLPWIDGKTIIEYIIEQLLLARVEHIVVVTGHKSDDVTNLVKKYDVTTAYNPLYSVGEMLSSLKTGLKAMPDHIAATMVVLGDQPRIEPRTINMVMAAYAEGRGEIIAPSYDMRRGHPILIDRKFWREIIALPFDGVPRDVINAHNDVIGYVLIDNDSVLQDVDTPEAYQEARRRAGLD